MNIYLDNINETQAFASMLARIAKTGDIITFSGDLGVGKTSFIQFFIKSLAGQEIEVTSPTFNLLHIYKFNIGEVWHFDLYRLRDKKEIYELGIEDAFSYAISLIEWPEIINDILPKDRLEIKLSFGEDENSRSLSLKAYGNWKEKLLLGLASSEKK
jgi:tRNA threonylcarbamoyl adenosine modification protein YjeE